MPRWHLPQGTTSKYTSMLFARCEVCMAKNCDQGLVNAARGRRLRAAFSRPRLAFFAVQTNH